MRSLSIWTFLVLSYQTIIILTIGSLTFKCQFYPEQSENQEVTLLKMLYLYDPQACERTVYYNYTRALGEWRHVYIIVWFQENAVAQRFSHNTRITQYLQVMWCVLGFVYMSYSQKGWAFYTVLVPFTLAGLAGLAFDMIHASYFIADSLYTQSEVDILKYINQTSLSLKSLRPIDYPADLDSVYLGGQSEQSANTSWIALMMAFFSIRGVVQWIGNFWIIEDNYFEGIAIYRRLRSARISSNIKKRRSTRPAV